MSKLNVFPLGGKGAAGDYPNVLGQKQCFTSQPATQVAGIFVQADGIAIETTLVQNNSGGDLSPNTCVKWDGANVGTKVGGVTAAGDVGAGIVDPWLNGVVKNGEVFHLIREGKCRGVANAAIAAGAQVMPDASGRLITMAATVAGVAARCGRITTAAAAAGDVREFVFDFEV